jgi:hypothetical protein
VLAQRHIDTIRVTTVRRDARCEVPDLSPRAAPPDLDRVRFVEIFHRALAAVVAALVPRDRLRLALYYGQDLTAGADRPPDRRTRGDGFASPRQDAAAASGAGSRSGCAATRGWTKRKWRSVFSAPLTIPARWTIGDILRKKLAANRSNNGEP